MKGGTIVLIKSTRVVTEIQEVDKSSSPNLFRCSTVGKRGQQMRWFTANELASQ